MDQNQRHPNIEMYNRGLAKRMYCIFLFISHRQCSCAVHHVILSCPVEAFDPVAVCVPSAYLICSRWYDVRVCFSTGCRSPPCKDDKWICLYNLRLTTNNFGFKFSHSDIANVRSLERERQQLACGMMCANRKRSHD